MSQQFNSYKEKNIEQFFGLEAEREQKDIYSELSQQLSCEQSYINEQFVRSWIHFTQKLRDKCMETEANFVRFKISGTQTTIQLLQQQRSQPQSFLSSFMDQKFQSIKEQIQYKQNNIPQLTSSTLQSALVECSDNIKIAEEIQNLLLEYKKKLEEHELQTSYNSQNSTLFNCNSEVQTVRQNEYPFQ